MPKTITRVAHRHGEQKETDPDLVLEIGKPLPGHYQAGRPPLLSVESIEGIDPLICTLSDGDKIMIRPQAVTGITRSGG